MWYIHNGLLMSYPDDVPPPLGSERVKVPKGFEGDPTSYRLVGKKVVRLSRRELQTRQQVATEGILTLEEVRRVRQAIRNGLL